MNATALAIALIGASGQRAWAVDDYSLGVDAQSDPARPAGTLEKFSFKTSQIFPGTERDYWVYVPPGYNPKQPPALMVFQDGWGYANPKGQFRATVVLDNLIARKEIPPILGVFVNPGNVPAAEPGGKGRGNRSYEYDALGDRYTRFLLEELLPEVKKRWTFSSDPKFRATVGISSGGICAFTVAWERPDQFGKVISHIGSFTNIRGGNVYPSLIRKTERKPIRVFLQDGSNDLDNLHGSWPLANQEMAAAMKFQGYDYKFEFGNGTHSGKHGGAIFPDTLRWIWRDKGKQ